MAALIKAWLNPYMLKIHSQVAKRMFVLMKSKYYRDLGNWLLSGSFVVPAELHHVWTGTSRTKSVSTMKPNSTERSPKGEITQLSTKICTEVISPA